jgi:RNA polymerase sigma factor (sigma-70 family)
MTERDDHQLLEEFARENSEPAFGALVQRHLNLVYSAALRHAGNVHAAEEITQAVFIILARKAGKISRRVVLSGWLWQTARLTAANHLRAEARRARREQEAFMQSQLDQAGTGSPASADETIWPQIAPLLDEALGKLGTRDRDAIVLRFFENKNLREVGLGLGTGEDAAKMRVNRALEKLRKIFWKRGVTLTTALIAGAVSTNSVQAAPAVLSKAVTATAFVKGSAASASTITLVNGVLKLMAWLKVKTAAVVAAGVLIAAGTTTWVISAASHQDLDPQTIFTQTARKYASLSSYASTGNTVEIIDNKRLTTSFTMKLGRTDLYSVEYEQHAPTFTNKGSIWSDGSGHYFTNHMPAPPAAPGPGHVMTDHKSPFSGLEAVRIQMGIVSDISGGATTFVPGMFYGIRMDGTWGFAFDPAKCSKIVNRELDEKVGNTDCFVLSYRTDDDEVCFWIGQEDLLLRKSRQIHKPKPDEVSDAEIEAMLAANQRTLSISKSDLKTKINAARSEAWKTMKPVTVVLSKDENIPGLKSVTVNPPNPIVFTSTYENIVVNQNDTATEPQETPFLIVPRESVGKVRKGMTTNEVESALGKPEKWQGKIMVYDKKLGMSVGQTKLGAMVVFCGDNMLNYPGVKKFKGRTKEGIGMKSSREDVIRAFGQPNSSKPWDVGQEQLEYKSLGLTFILEAGKVINITVDFRQTN